MIVAFSEKNALPLSRLAPFKKGPLYIAIANLVVPILRKTLPWRFSVSGETKDLYKSSPSVNFELSVTVIICLFVKIRSLGVSIAAKFT